MAVGPANAGDHTARTIEAQQDARNHQNAVAKEGLKTKADDVINKAAFTAVGNTANYV